MMGRDDPPQPSLFYTSFNLDKRVRPNHLLRKVAKVIDFGFVADEELKGSGPEFGNIPSRGKPWGQFSLFTLFL